MKKEFDAVEFQRKAREKISKDFLKNKVTFTSGLQKKYGTPKKKKQSQPKHVFSK